MTPELIGAPVPLFVGLPLLVAGLLVISGPRLRQPPWSISPRC